jgi:DNA-nicking Smr family endonuclease
MAHRPTDEDKKLWKHVTKGIEPYHRHKETSDNVSTSKKKQHVDKTLKIKEKAAFVSPLIKDNYKSDTGPQPLDRRTETRLKRGQIQIEGRIDLHGMTQEAAHDALVGFISKSCQQGKRCVLVITGKGRLSAPGKIRQNLSGWLYDYPLTGMVLRHVIAQPVDGGAGAFYVYLKRQKD